MLHEEELKPGLIVFLFGPWYATSTEWSVIEIWTETDRG
jgi:hypothetical protein